MDATIQSGAKALTGSNIHGTPYGVLMHGLLRMECDINADWDYWG